MTHPQPFAERQTLPDGTTCLVLRADVPAPPLALPHPFAPLDDPDCTVAYMHPSGLCVMQLRADGSYQVGHGVGATLALACLSELHRARKHVLDAADEASADAAHRLADYLSALADVLEVALR